MTNPHPFSLLYGEQPEDESQNQSVNHAAFRRPTPETAPTASADAAGQASPSGPKDASKDAAQGDEAAASDRFYAQRRSASQLKPLVSVLPASLFKEEEPPAAQAPKTHDAPKPAPQRFPDVPKDAAQPAQAPAEQKAIPVQETRSIGAGKKKALIVGIVLLLLVGVVCLDRFFMPMFRYREALRQEAEGNFDRAAHLYAALGDYRDSSDRAAQLPAKKTIALMNEGKYQEALDLLEAEDKNDPLIADCLYALGVLAYNDGDAETGLAYVAKLQKRFPDYAGTKELEQYCNYSLGQQYAAEASAIDYTVQRDISLELAYKYFDAAGDYGDAKEQAMECRYLLFCGLSTMDPTPTILDRTVSILGEMGDYRDAANMRLRVMYGYVLEHYIDYWEYDGNVTYSIVRDDKLVNTYLDELAASDYEDAQAILDRMNGKGFSVKLTYGDETTPLPDVVTDLSEIYVHCEIPNWENLEPVQPFLSFVLPYGASYTVLMDASGSTTGRLDQYFEFDEKYDEYFEDPIDNGWFTVALTDGNITSSSFSWDEEDNIVLDNGNPECVARFQYERN